MMPNPGEIVFFDRSWYNRAVVEPVMGFCSSSEYNSFMSQVNEFEKMLIEDEVHIIKFWFFVNKNNFGIIKSKTEETSRTFRIRLKYSIIGGNRKLGFHRWCYLNIGYKMPVPMNTELIGFTQRYDAVSQHVLIFTQHQRQR